MGLGMAGNQVGLSGSNIKLEHFALPFPTVVGVAAEIIKTAL